MHGNEENTRRNTEPLPLSAIFILCRNRVVIAPESVHAHGRGLGLTRVSCEMKPDGKARLALRFKFRATPTTTETTTETIQVSGRDYSARSHAGGYVQPLNA